MPFLSIEFALFFLGFFILYWRFGHSPKAQNDLLLAAGLGWLYLLNPIFAAVVCGVTVWVWLWAKAVVRSRAAVAVGIIGIVLNLFIFKYYDFFRPNLQEAAHITLPDLLFPLGISYYSFQAASYLVSLKRKLHPPLALDDLLLHLSFFPTITAGPIFRTTPVRDINGTHQGAYSQIVRTQRRRPVKPALAVVLILSGLIKKWGLSGALGDQWVDPVFNDPLQYGGFDVLAATAGYTVQLFLDFSGYTDLVIGMAMLLGFSLPQNFNMPLKAFNLRDFWERWHISLSTWIRDYIYIPLGGSRGGFLRTQANLMIAMVLSGIWHGYGATFAIWGAVHGLGLVLLNIGDKITGKRAALSGSGFFGRILAIVFTLAFVCLTFVIFRAPSTDDAFLMFRALFANPNGWHMPSQSTAGVLAVMAAALIFYPPIAAVVSGSPRWLARLPWWLWPVPICTILFLLTVFAPPGIPGFIYANF